MLPLKSELKDIATVSKIYAKSQKVTAETAERIIRLEKVSSDLKIQEVKAKFESARSSTNLTEEQVKQFALSSDLLDFENDTLLKKENQAQVQAAIGAFREKELLLLEEAINMVNGRGPIWNQLFINCSFSLGPTTVILFVTKWNTVGVERIHTSQTIINDLCL